MRNAAPIRDENKNLVVVVSVVTLASRVYPEADAGTAQKALDTAQEVSDRLAVVVG
nr:IclR family transcriptional regulator C-terminal domain-containing protein [Streptomyces sp. SAI-133]